MAGGDDAAEVGHQQACGVLAPHLPVPRDVDQLEFCVKVKNDQMPETVHPRHGKC